MTIIGKVIPGLTGVVTREYGSFHYGQVVSGFPIPTALRESYFYRFIETAPEEADPAYNDAANRISEFAFNKNSVAPTERDRIALDYLLTHNGYFIPPDQKKQLLENLVLKSLAIKALVREGDCCSDADVDVGFYSDEMPQWVGYRVVIWGELGSANNAAKPPVVHYFK